MKKTGLLLLAASSLCLSSCDAQSQSKIGNILGQVATGATGTPSSLEISNGLKQALEIGTSAGADRLSTKDGFFGNMAIKILFPTEAQKVEKTLRSVGLNSL